MSKDFLKKEGEKYGDFSLIKGIYIEEVQSFLRQILHLPTGALVVHLENDDPENLFNLSFKTLPNSSNGAPHILEHTVLCGSRKYPVKDPFFSMTRRSLNTFMNALTGADFTCYPASSQVEKDFYNLLEVYLDAVFHPLLREESFLQEGHRLEFSDPEDPTSPLEFKGIVYNEMKGALSSIDSRIWHAILKVLLPDLTYAHNSGGDPSEIPNLTYAELIEFHETFYHPSRCLFFFYGNFPLKKHLDFIEEKALKNVPHLSPLAGIGHQKRFEKPKSLQMSYPTSEEEDLEDKHIHAVAWLTAPLLDQEDVLALTILDSVLMETDASPLKKGLLEANLCVNVDSYLDIEMTEVPFLMLFRECEKDAKKIEKVLFHHLEEIAKKGLAFDLIESAIHQLEFGRTEIGGGSSPFGLTLFMRSALAMQHGCAPEKSLQVHALFADLLEKARDPFFFSPLIKKYFIENPHRVWICFSPDPELSAKEEEEEKNRLQKIKATLSEKEKARIIDQSKRLRVFQEHQEDTSLDCLPKVILADIPAEARHFKLKEDQRRNLNIFHHNTFTNQILYAELFFDLPDLSEEELIYLELFILFWPELGVANRTFEENLNYISAYTGGVGAHMSLHVQANDPSKSLPSFQIHGKALKRNMGKLFSLFEEMATKPRFDEKRRIKELLQKLGSQLQNYLSQNSMRYASQLALSSYSTPSHITELCHGLSFYKEVLQLAKNPTKGAALLSEKFNYLKEKILLSGNSNLILSCDDDLYQELDKHNFYDLPRLKPKPFDKWKGTFPLPKVADQGRIIPSPVAFTAQGFKTIHYTHKDAPALLVATHLLENKVLHHRIREQGGAYGSGANYNPLWGNFYFYAYRDPHIARTLRTFSDSIHEISDGQFNRQDLEEAKMGIVQQLDTPISPGNRGIVAYIWRRDGKTRQMQQDFRDRLLHLSIEDLTDALKIHLLPQVNEGKIVTFAGKELLEKELPLIENRKLEIFPATR